jgi:DNA-binding transcriptional ArsR family regulator
MTDHTRLSVDAIRVLAHPLRSRLLGQLRREGPATATALARSIGTNTGATSYHLRKLASVGLVEETGEGQGRERWWRPAHEMHSWFPSDVAGDRESEEAAAWLEGYALRLFSEQASQWQAEESGWSPQWRDAAGASDYPLRLSPEQLTTLNQELSAVLDRYSRLDPLPGAQRVHYFLHAFPQRRGDEA